MPEQQRFLRGLFPWPAKALVAIAGMLAVASYAWHRIEAARDADPPAGLGVAAGGGFFACPDVQGEYTWARRRASDGTGGGRGWKGSMPYLVHEPETQVWIRRDGRGLEIRSRLVVRARNVRNRLAQEWTAARYEGWEVSCRRGVLEVDEREVETGEDFGGTGIRRGFKLVRLTDGTLAVGVKTISFGRTAPLFGWGDVSRGSIPLPPRTTWQWVRLTQVGPGASEPAPVKGPSGSTRADEKRR
jgi:hypothetical protein